MLIFSIISFILAGLGFMGGLITQGGVRLSFFMGSILFLIIAIGFLFGRRAIRELKKNISREMRLGERGGKESEIMKAPPVPEKPGVFLREQDMVFGPNGKGAFSVSFWFEEQSTDSQEYLGMQELDYLFLELEGDYKLTRREEEINNIAYIVYTFQSGYQVDFNQSRYINFEEREDKSYFLEIKLGKLNGRINRTITDTLVIKVTLPAKINMANSMTYEDRTVEWRLTGAHFKKDLTLKAFTVPFALS